VSRQHRVLIVDDESRILESVKRSVRGPFEVETAASAELGLSMLRHAGPYAVVVSDVRMPGGDGISFLNVVRRASPDTVRMLLTGYHDIDAAMKAVNDNQIFRFLRKPCPAPALVAAIEAGIAQHELIIAERELLEETLRGCVHALGEVLGMTSPLAFARAVRVRECVGGFADRYGIPDRWQYEVAALLSQLGAASLPKETTEKIYFGRPLTTEEQVAAATIPTTAAHVVAAVPRLEGVREILNHLNADYVAAAGHPGPSGDAIPLGARILRIAFDFDVLVTQGASVGAALQTLAEHRTAYDPDVLQDFSAWQGEAALAQRTRHVPLPALTVGMILAADVITEQGVLLIARGQAVTPRVVRLIQTYWVNQPLRGPVCIVDANAPASDAITIAGAPAGAGA
jgi:response regulator RpfG family c-di-GMP phosphodiesterase